MARTTIFTILPGQGLPVCTGRFCKAAARDPFHSVLILPTKRLAGEIRDQMRERGLPFLPDLVGTPEEVARAVLHRYRPAIRVMERDEARSVFLAVLKERPAGSPLITPDRQPGIRQADDLGILRKVIEARMIDYPACLAELQGQRSTEVGAVLDAYRTLLEHRRLVDSDSVLACAAGAVREAAQRWQVFVYGLYEPPASLRGFLGAFRAGEGEFSAFVPYAQNPAVFADRWEWMDADEYHTIAGEGSGWLPIFGGEEASGACPVRTMRPATREAEVRAIAAEVSRLLEEGTPPGGITVAFPDIRAAAPLLEEAFADAAIPYATATRPSLATIPLVQVVLLAAGIPAGRYRREDVAALFSSPYFRFNAGNRPLTGGDVERLAREAGISEGLRSWERGLERLCARYAAEAGDGGEAAAARAATGRVQAAAIMDVLRRLKTLEGVRPASGHVRALGELLAAWDAPFIPPAPDDAVGAAEEEAWSLLNGTLRRLGSSPTSDQRISQGEFLGLWTTMVRETRLSPVTDNGRVQVTGIRELAHMRVPHLFLADLTDGRMPDIPPLLPYTTEREEGRMGTQSRREKLREERYYFLAALSAAEKEICLSAALAEGTTPLVESPFLRMVEEATGAVPCDAETETIWSARSRAAGAGRAIAGGYMPAAGWLPEGLGTEEVLSRIRSEAACRTGGYTTAWDGILTGEKEITADLAARFGPERAWSPTSLDMYVACPFRFYCAYVLGLAALPEAERTISAADQGALVHEILRGFYERWRAAGHPGRPARGDHAAASAVVRDVARRETDRYHWEGPVWEVVKEQLLGTADGEGLFGEFLAEEEKAADSALDPSLFEVSFGIAGKVPSLSGAPVPLPVPGGDGVLRVRGTIDRVDAGDDGTCMVTDYKTGTAPTQKDIREGRALQLPLYLRALETVTGMNGVACGYYTIRQGKTQNSIVAHDPAAAPLLGSIPKKAMPADEDFTRMIDGAVTAAARAVAGIRSGRFPPSDGIRKCPSYCDYSSICRFSSLRTLTCADAAGDDEDAGRFPGGAQGGDEA
ncbi:MAG TPA: PD-(D/E)XK nuclease family protein [Methanoculleus sp.]|nr:PD-(D/E)XK nuclease family protein [Methanoculleus sp.]